MVKVGSDLPTEKRVISFRNLIRAVAFLGLASCLHGQEASSGLRPPSIEPVNRQLPEWLRLGAEYMARLEGPQGLEFRPDNDDFYWLSRIRLELGLHPSKRWHVFFQAQDARAYGKNSLPPGNIFQDRLDLRLAYLQIGNSENGGARLKIGRQDMTIGDGWLVGTPDWRNISRSFDAVRLTVVKPRYTLEAWAASDVVIQDGQFNRHRPGDNLHGTNLRIAVRKDTLNVEPFFYWRVAPRVTAERGAFTGKADVRVPGFSVFGKLSSGYDYRMMLVHQSGRYAGLPIEAWGGRWLFGRSFKPRSTAYRVGVEYNHATGDDDPTDGVHRTFNVLHPAGHDKLGLSDAMGWQNVRHLNFAFESMLPSRWRGVARHHFYWTDSSRDGLYNPQGRLRFAGQDGLPSRYMGQEFNFQFMKHFSPRTELRMGYAYLFAGSYIRSVTPGSGYSFPYIMLIHRR
jgi:hypothetical protein